MTKGKTIDKSVRLGTIYLSNTDFGKAIYLPKGINGVKILCPAYTRQGFESFSVGFLQKSFCHFYENYEELRREFRRRIRNPQDNAKITIITFGSSREVMPLPVKKLEPSEINIKNLERLVADITFFFGDGYQEFLFSFSNRNESILNDYGELNRLKGYVKGSIKFLELLEDYLSLYNQMYQMAQWVGKSKEAAEWYEQNRRK